MEMVEIEVTLTDEEWAFADRLVAEGEFEDRSAVMRAALDWFFGPQGPGVVRHLDRDPSTVTSVAGTQTCPNTTCDAITNGPFPTNDEGRSWCPGCDVTWE